MFLTGSAKTTLLMATGQAGALVEALLVRNHNPDYD
jgi:hypothetical protein